MYNKQIHAIISKISPMDETEQEHKNLVLEWIESGVELCRLQKPATPPMHLVSYFIPFDAEAQKILLVDHKKAELWLPPGGHVEPGEHPNDTAHRELKEELNISLPLLWEDPILLTVTKTVGKTSGHTDVSLWYVYDADASKNYQYDEEEFEGIKWYSLDDLPIGHTDPHLERFRDKLAKAMELMTVNA